MQILLNLLVPNSMSHETIVSIPDRLPPLVTTSLTNHVQQPCHDLRKVTNLLCTYTPDASSAHAAGAFRVCIHAIPKSCQKDPQLINPAEARLPDIVWMPTSCPWLLPSLTCSTAESWTRPGPRTTNDVSTDNNYCQARHPQATEHTSLTTAQCTWICPDLRNLEVTLEL